MQVSDKTVKFMYKNWRGEVAERTVTPSRIYFGISEHHNVEVEAADGDRKQWYMVAWCHDRGDYRDFSLKDIQGNIRKAM